MSNISKRRKDGSRAKIKSMGDHQEFLKRITKTLYYGQLPPMPCLSLPVTEISCSVWSAWQRGRSVRRLHADAAAQVSRAACVSPAALVLALLYMERLRASRPDYLAATPPADLFLVTLMVGNKFLQDDGEDEEVICSEWASSGGMELDQLKKLEIEFLNAIDWNVFVNEQSFETGLKRLERRVALKQAALRGFFTYGDLAAAADSGPATEALTALAAATLAYLGGLFALVTSTLVMTQVWVPALRQLAALSALTSPARPDLLLPAPPPPAFLPPLTLTEYVPNSTLDGLVADLPEDPVERLACCAQWARYRASVPRERNDREGTVATEWKSSEPQPWWSRLSALGWLYHSSLVSPLQRWLERINEYVDLFKREMYLNSNKPVAQCRDYDGSLRRPHRQKCVRQWLNLSKLGALVVSMSDR